LTDKHSDLTIHAAHELLKAKKISSVELTQDYLARIKAVDPQVRAIVTITAERALEQAKKSRRADCRRQSRAFNRCAVFA